MRWKNLKKNRCPTCGLSLLKSMVPAREGMIKCKCGFMTSEQRYKEIVSDMVTKDLKEDDEWRDNDIDNITGPK